MFSEINEPSTPEQSLEFAENGAKNKQTSS